MFWFGLLFAGRKLRCREPQVHGTLGRPGSGCGPRQSGSEPHMSLLSPRQIAPHPEPVDVFLEGVDSFPAQCMPIKAQPAYSPPRICFGRPGLLLDQAYSHPDSPPPDHPQKENCPVEGRVQQDRAAPITLTQGVALRHRHGNSLALTALPGLEHLP